MSVVEQNGLVGLPYSPPSLCKVPFVVGVKVLVPPLPVTDLPLWVLSSSLLPGSELVAPVLTGCALSRILLELGLAELSFALMSMPPTLT